MGRNLVDSQVKNSKGRINQVRPKSEKFRTVTSTKTSEPSSSNLIQKNLDNYIFNLSNFELKQKLESCPGNLGDCPVLNDFREGLKKSISNHVNLTSRNDNRLCKTSRNHSAVYSKMIKPKSTESGDKKRAGKDLSATSSNTSRGIVRSTRAQELRSQSNRDLMKPKTTMEKSRSASPYLISPQKKKKNPDIKSTVRSFPQTAPEEKKKLGKIPNKNDKKQPNKTKKKEKPSSAGEEISLQRQRTQEIINPKIVKKIESVLTNIKPAAGDCELQLRKSQTFFICKGTKGGEGDEKSKESDISSVTPQTDSHSEGTLSDDEISSPKLKPLTHNDSFCLIVKSSQNWSQKNRSDDEKWLRYGLSYEEKAKKPSDRGILKNSNYDLKSVDSLEKVDSEKIVRFSDELSRNKKVLKKLVRRKKRFQNFFSTNWYQKNKLFQKYLQILREKSVLLSDRTETPDELKSFRVPLHVKERHEAEMLGLCPRKGKFLKKPTNAYSY